METDEGVSGKPQSLGDDEGSSLSGRNEYDELQNGELQCQRDLDDARNVETRLPVSDVDSSGVVIKEDSEDEGMGGGLLQSDVSEKDQILGEVEEAREVVTVKDDEARVGVEKQEVNVTDLCDASGEATETSDVAGGCVDNQAREIEDLDDTAQQRGTVTGDRVENSMAALVGDGNALTGECSVSEHVGSVDKLAEDKNLDETVTGEPHVAEEEVNLDGTGTTREMKSSPAEHGGSMYMFSKVAEEKDLDEAVLEVPHVAEERVDLDETAIRNETESSVSEHVGSADMVGIVAKETGLDEAMVEVPQIAEEEVSLDGITTRDEIGSAVSVDVGGMVYEEKDLDAAVGEVLHVAAEEVNIAETVMQKDREVMVVGVESGKDDEMMKVDETTIDTDSAGLDNMSRMAVEANETDRVDDESGKMDQTNQADDTAMEMEKRESEMVGDAVQVKEEVNRVKSEDAPLESDVRGLDTATEKNNNVDIVEEINKVNNEFDGDDMLEKTAEAVYSGAEIEVAEQENLVEMGTAEAEEEADGSCMEESMKGEDAEVPYEADDMYEEADSADVMEAVDAEEAEPTEEQIRSTAIRKRKRGKNPKGPGRAPSKKKIEEDVCFICFDGGELVLCDRRGCPKAYHPSCVNRDEVFFRSKGRWNCGWHLCSNCEKNAYYMCYTCTYSLCKGCVKDAVILCVRGNKGLCETCMRTVMLIEQHEQENKDMQGQMNLQGQVNFDDKSSWEYLFKDYWMDLKGRLSLTHDELAQAKNPRKGSEPLTTKESHELYDANKDRGSDSDSACGNIGLKSSKRRKPKKRLKSRTNYGDSHSKVTGEGPSADGNSEWASKELLDFVMHMRNGDKSILSQFDVQALLLEYIKRNKLRDPRRKSQIICDARLQNLFGKQRVGHFEMLKLLESHFLLKEDSQIEDLQESVVDTEASQLEGDQNSESFTKTVKDKKRKTRKKSDNRGFQSNLDDYAAIDTHNINLIYLKRKLAEDLIENAETFHDKVVGSFARIRISAGGQKQDLYRLVQVVGTSKGTEPYKLGKMMTDTLLEILNLSKKEVISIDIISNQEFTEDECKRLRQSIKCGLINRLTVGDIREKAVALQEVRVKDWLEAEILRVSHLRDRASDMGHRKELRECVEKLQMLKAPEERQRRLEEIPEIHVDPNMDPSYESEDEIKQENNMKPRARGFSSRKREPINSQTSGGPQSDIQNCTSNLSNANRELTRSMSDKCFSRDVTDMTSTSHMGHDRSWKQGRDMDRESHLSSSWEKPKLSSNAEISSRNSRPVVISGTFSSVTEGSATRSSTAGAQPAPKINETEKMWHYKDPSGKVQGPFSMAQLRKWSNTGYFPADLRIWKVREMQDDSILLTDALAGTFQKEPSLLLKNQMVHDSHQSSSYSGKPPQNVEAPLVERSQLVQSGGSWNLSGGSLGRPALESRSSKDDYSLLTPKPDSFSVEVPKNSTNEWVSGHARQSELMNLPSPTPKSIPGEAKAQAVENIRGSSSGLSFTSVMGMRALTGVANGLQSPAAVNSDLAGQGSENASLNSIPTAPVSTHFPANTSLNPVLQQNSAQSMSNYNTQAETKGWGSPLVSKPELTASTRGSESKVWVNTTPQRIEHNTAVAPAQWGNTPSVQSPNFNTGNTTGTYSAACFPGMISTDTWRQPALVSQSNAQPLGAPNLQWGVAVANDQSGVPRPIPENQNTAWGVMQGNQNMGWTGPVHTNTNVNWLPGQLPASGNVNPGWAAPMQGSSAIGAMPGWTGPMQAQPQMSANPGWAAPGQGPPPSNTNSSWNLPPTNPNMWGGEQSHGGNRYTNTGGRVPHGGDSGYSESQPWNRQSSFNGDVGGGGPVRPPFKGQRVCKYHESGHCRKGASCDYFHN